MTPRSYQTPKAFKDALEATLKRQAKGGQSLPRLRQLVVFNRFLARVAAEMGDAATLKGGLALELRLDRARTTRDVDLRVVGDCGAAGETLARVAALDLNDFMTFRIRPDKDHPEIQGSGLIYDGLRFRAECRIAGQIYADPFGVDVAFGDPILGEPDVVDAEDWLAFAGISPPRLRVYPIETHLAEKLHAYTMPRPTPNSRVKDLPDIALLGTVQTLQARRIRQAFNETFTFRGTHSLPNTLPEPPTSWQIPYSALSKNEDLEWRSLADVTAAARAFIDPVLSGGGEYWDPHTRAWSADVAPQMSTAPAVAPCSDPDSTYRDKIMLLMHSPNLEHIAMGQYTDQLAQHLNTTSPVAERAARSLVRDGMLTESPPGFFRLP